MSRLLRVLIGVSVLLISAPAMATPITTNGLVLWLDAQDIDGDGNPANNPANGTFVGTTTTPWVDKAPLQGSQNATQATTGLQPTYWNSAQNGLAAVRFDGNDILAASSLEYGTFTYFAAVRANSGSVLVFERSVNSNTYDGEYLCMSTSFTVNIRRSGARSYHDVTGITGDGNFKLVEYSYGGTNATHLLFFDGTQQTLTGGTLADPGTGSITETLYIGDRPNLGHGLKGDMAELLVYNRVLTSAERNQVGFYLATKYGLATAYVPEPGALCLLALGAFGAIPFWLRGTRKRTRILEELRR